MCGPAARLPIVELGDFFLAQSHALAHLFLRQGNLPPRLSGELTLGVAFEHSLGMSFDLVSRPAQLAVADIEHATIITPEQRRDFVD
jgi:hypothetical protein